MTTEQILAATGTLIAVMGILWRITLNHIMTSVRASYMDRDEVRVMFESVSKELGMLKDFFGSRMDRMERRIDSKF